MVLVPALLMVSTIRYSSLKASGRGRPGFILVLVLAGVGMAIWFYSQYVLVVLAGIYVSHGLIWWMARYTASKLRRPTSDGRNAG